MTSDHGIPRLHVRASFSKTGDFVIEGQHLGAGAHIGRQDYEYYVTVRVASLPALAAALGCEVDGILAAWNEQSAVIVNRGERRWLAEHDVPSDVWVA
jgi:hypothetical protein